jgi:hypothetical protein
MCYKENPVRSNHPVMILRYTVCCIVRCDYSSASLGSFRSEGHFRRSLRSVVDGLLKLAMQVLLCPINRLWYLVEYLAISSGIIGIWRSLRSVTLETYHGALAIERRTLDWSLWSILMFEGLAHPHI